MKLSDYKAKGNAPRWIEHFERQTKAYQTDNVLILWGDDFAHEFADSSYENLAKII